MSMCTEPAVSTDCGRLNALIGDTLPEFTRRVAEGNLLVACLPQGSERAVSSPSPSSTPSSTSAAAARIIGAWWLAPAPVPAGPKVVRAMADVTIACSLPPPHLPACDRVGAPWLLRRGGGAAPRR